MSEQSENSESEENKEELENKDEEEVSPLNEKPPGEEQLPSEDGPNQEEAPKNQSALESLFKRKMKFGQIPKSKTHSEGFGMLGVGFYESDEEEIEKTEEEKQDEREAETKQRKNEKIQNKVLVTGAAGYLGSHIVAILLGTGYKVKGTVRSLSSKEKYQHLFTLNPLKRDNLEVVEADLSKTGIWDKLVADCEYVIHCASPHPIKPPKKEIDVVYPAVEGTLGLLDAITRSPVRKVVVTSSASAVYGGHIKNIYSEADWADPEFILSYERSKLYAERSAWKFVKDHPQIKLTTLCPALLLGPTLGNTDEFFSGDFIKKLSSQKLKATIKLKFPIADVRDTAMAHVKAMESKTSGNRMIVCQGSYWLEDLLKIVANEFSSENFMMPGKELGYFSLKFVSLFDREVKLIMPYCNQNIYLSNEKSIFDLKLVYREIDETVVDMVHNFIKKDWIQNLGKPKK